MTDQPTSTRAMPRTHANADQGRENLPPDHIGVLIAAAVMVVGGWWGLYALITQTLPRPGQIWMLFMLLQIAITGTMIPVVRFLNSRFTPVDRPLVPGGVLVRQATWVGLFVVTCAWLQIPRVLNGSIVFFLAIVFVILEIFLRSRERQAEANLLDE